MTFYEYINERHRIWERRIMKVYPWTENEVLATRHFPNVFRFHDPLRRMLKNKISHMPLLDKLRNVWIFNCIDRRVAFKPITHPSQILDKLDEEMQRRLICAWECEDVSIDSTEDFAKSLAESTVISEKLAYEIMCDMTNWFDAETLRDINDWGPNFEFHRDLWEQRSLISSITGGFYKFRLPEVIRNYRYYRQWTDRPVYAPSPTPHEYLLP